MQGHTWNLVLRRSGSLDASTLDGTVFVSSGERMKGWREKVKGDPCYGACCSILLYAATRC